MARGSALKYKDLGNYFDSHSNAGLRIVISYNIGTDSLIARLDFKIKERQYNAGFFCGTPIEKKSGSNFNPTDDLITPSAGVENCINIKANKDEILRALKELISDIENDKLNDQKDSF